jgi:hypothetical protein
MRVDIAPQNEMTEMGVLFRARKNDAGEGEGYFAIVTAVNQELVVGYARSGEDYDILSSVHVDVDVDADLDVAVDEMPTLSVEAQGDLIVVRYKDVFLEILDGRAMSGAVGLITTQGEGLFRGFSAEGTCGDDFEPNPNPHHNGFSHMESLQSHQGEWFNDGHLAGNINADEDASLITFQEFGDLFLHTRVLTRTEDTKMGVIFRATQDDAGNSQGYFAGLSAEDNQLVLGYRFADGEDLIIASAHMNVEIGVFYDLNIELEGARIRVESNGVVLETEAEYSFYGVAGLFANDGLALFTDFFVEDRH